MDTKQVNKLFANEIDFCRRSATKSRKEKVRNGTIRANMEVIRSNIVFRSNWRKMATMVWMCKDNTRKKAATENFRMETRGKAKKGKTQREMDGLRRSITNHSLT
jgi:hypothetical protein